MKYNNLDSVWQEQVIVFDSVESYEKCEFISSEQILFRVYADQYNYYSLVKYLGEYPAFRDGRLSILSQPNIYLWVVGGVLNRLWIKRSFDYWECYWLNEPGVFKARKSTICGTWYHSWAILTDLEMETLGYLDEIQ